MQSLRRKRVSFERHKYLSKATMASASSLYAEIRAKSPLDYKTRKALLSHWSPRIAKAIAKKVDPDFRGSYEQNLWLLTHKAAETAVGPRPTGWTTYGWEAKEKGVKFLWPYPRIEDTRICAPSHYLYYILKTENAEVNAILARAYRFSERLNKKYLAKALRLHEVYAALPQPRSLRFDEEDENPPLPSAADIKLRLKRRKALKASVKAEMMLSAENNIEFKVIAYGWTHLKKTPVSSC
jgi:hypothetical protein